MSKEKKSLTVMQYDRSVINVQLNELIKQSIRRFCEMITRIEAIYFLKKHQPMPKDDELKEEEIQKYEEVRKFFIDNPDECCIPLFLNSFGGKDGLGLYQMIEDVILMYDVEKVLPYVIQSLDSPYDGVKYWVSQIASNFPDDSLFDPLSNLL